MAVDGSPRKSKIVVLGPDALPLFAPFAVSEALNGVALSCAEQLLVRSVVGDAPADARAPRQDDAEGLPPPPPLPSALLAEKSSDADDGALPQLVPRLASVGRPGVASAVEQVEAYVGSSAEAIPAARPANAPVAVATAFTRTREPEVETLLRLVSALAAGPDVVGVGADPSGVDGLGCDADPVAGTVALVPGPAAEVEPRAGAFGAAVFELDAVIGSLVAMVAGPALPPLADADPPAVDPAGSGWRFGSAETVGSAASAPFPQTPSKAMTAMSSSSFFISRTTPPHVLRRERDLVARQAADLCARLAQ